MLFDCASLAGCFPLKIQLNRHPQQPSRIQSAQSPKNRVAFCITPSKLLFRRQAPDLAYWTLKLDVAWDTGPLCSQHAGRTLYPCFKAIYIGKVIVQCKRSPHHRGDSVMGHDRFSTVGTCPYRNAHFIKDHSYIHRMRSIDRKGDDSTFIRLRSIDTQPIDPLQLLRCIFQQLLFMTHHLFRIERIEITDGLTQSNSGNIIGKLTVATISPPPKKGGISSSQCSLPYKTPMPVGP